MQLFLRHFQGLARPTPEEEQEHLADYNKKTKNNTKKSLTKRKNITKKSLTKRKNINKSIQEEEKEEKQHSLHFEKNKISGFGNFGPKIYKTVHLLLFFYPLSIFFCVDLCVFEHRNLIVFSIFFTFKLVWHYHGKNK